MNPDFGQVEADPSVVNLTAYETFYEEKRPFFLEGRKLFDFGIEDDDQLFYSRRIGQAPSYEPPSLPGETLRMPESTTILGAAKITGKTNGGLSVAVLQSFTQKETAARHVGARLARAGGGALRQLHRGPPAEGLGQGQHHPRRHGHRRPTASATTPPSRRFRPRRGAAGSTSRASSATARGAGGARDREPGRGRRARRSSRLQTNPVHYFQRDGASHLGVDPGATSLGGHGGSVLLGTSGKGRLRLTDHFHWYSPGLDLNDVGYLRQADLKVEPGLRGLVGAVPEGALPLLLVRAVAPGRVGLRRAPDAGRLVPRGLGHASGTSGRSRASWSSSR